MNRRKIRLSLLTLASVLLIGLSNAPLADAATSGGNGLRVSPVRTDLTINPGTTQTVNLSVTNVTGKAATLQVVVNDFTASPDESGNPAIILDPTKFASGHSLKRYIAPIASFTLAPGQQKAVPVTITIPGNAAAGGYYGAVRFAPASSTVGPNENISLAGSVGSLILVKVPGDIKEQLSIASFDVRHKNSVSSFFTTTKDLTAVVRFQNSGNIQEQPFGKILLRNRSGKILASYDINNVDPPGNVLPDSIRKFGVTLDKVKGFGIYKLEGNFGYGGGGQLLTASTTFYVIPIAVIIGFIVLVLVILFLVFGLPRLVRAYNRRVLRKAGKK